MEERAVEEKERSEARDRVRAQLARAAKVARMLADEDEDISDIPPHLLGR